MFLNFKTNIISGDFSAIKVLKENGVTAKEIYECGENSAHLFLAHCIHSCIYTISLTDYVI